jgi:hypothetical protein
MVVPDLDKPEVIGFELAGGRYREAAHVTGDETLPPPGRFPLK